MLIPNATVADLAKLAALLPGSGPFDLTLIDGAIAVSPALAAAATAIVADPGWRGREPPPTLAAYSDAIQAHVDATAASRGYGSGVLLASYVASTVPAWAAEAQAFVSWRDGVWTYSLAQLAAIQAATRPQPSVAALVAELPAIVWPS